MREHLFLAAFLANRPRHEPVGVVVTLRATTQPGSC
jgi:hypothetical protein